MKQLSSYLIILIIFFSAGCEKKLSGESYDPEGSTDTRTKPISFQVRKTWRMDNGKVSFSNEFTGARLNDVIQHSDSVFEAVINPENEPVNKSPWYGFMVWAEEPREIAVHFSYFGEYGHRYYPDYSTDLRTWQPMDSSRVLTDTTAHRTTILLNAGPDTLYIAAQEIMTSSYVYDKLDTLENEPYTSSEIIGYSTLGKPIPLVKMGNEESKEAIVILGRQHPPEATGFLALQAFTGRIAAPDDSLSRAFRDKFLTLLIPMINPDGVDQGHWRHSAAGIDLNRDWQYFNQPETSAVRSYIESFMSDASRKLLFEIDFHSTQEDLFYVFEPDQPSNMTGFTHNWLDAIEEDLGYYEADRVPTSGNSPVSTHWFYTQYNTEAVTYEVGDNSPREKIKEISTTAAEKMMELLLESESD